MQATLRHLGCKQVDGRWYLPGDEVPGMTMDIRDEASAIGWLRHILTNEGPQTRGALTPRFQQALVGVQLRKTLAELLEENFKLDERGNTWRLPTAEERARLNDTNLLRQRREINRLMDGHPARSYIDDELAELTIAAYRMGLYRAVLRLGPMVRTDVLSEERRTLLAQLSELAQIRLADDENDQPVQPLML